MQKGKQSLCFTEAPFIISTANIVGKKEGEGPLAGHFDVTHSMRLIQTGMSHLSMVYVQRVMQKLLSQQTLRDLQMSICWQTITSLI